MRQSKLLLSDRLCIRDRIFVSEILKTESQTAETINNSISNTVKNLNKHDSKHDSVAENITKETLQAILKYKDLPSILAIQNQFEMKTFRFT